jgi:hypothetical protein
MIQLMQIAFLMVTASASMPARAAATTLRAMRTVPLTGELADPKELSGIARWRGSLVICPDEGDTINVLRPADSGYELFGVVGLLTDSDKEIDMEGAASDSEYVYIVGSHSSRRTKIDEKGTYKKNRKRITRVRPHIESYSLYRLSLDNEGKLVQKERIDLRDVLEADEVVGPFFDMPGKENGVDIEGVAVKRGRLYVGFRGPVLRGNLVPVVTFKFDRPEDYQLRFVRLGGRGIRDLVAVENGFLVLAGPVGDGDGSYRLYFWNGQDCVPGEEESAGELTTLGDLAAEPGKKPDGITIMSESPAEWRLLVVHDGDPLASEWIVPKR